MCKSSNTAIVVATGISTRSLEHTNCGVTKVLAEYLWVGPTKASKQVLSLIFRDLAVQVDAF